MQAGKKGDAKSAPTIDELLAQAESNWRSKYDPHASSIDRLLAGGVTLRSIIGWLVGQGVKAEVGEFGRWVRRRQARMAKFQSRREVFVHAERDGVWPATVVPVLEPATTKQPTAPNTTKPAAVQAPRPWERRGDSDTEKAIDAVLQGVHRSAKNSRSPTRQRLLDAVVKKE